MNEKQIAWTEEKVISEIYRSMDVLSIDRMPTSTELKSIGANRLDYTIQRTKKYSGWAKYLGIKTKNEITKNRYRIRGKVTSILIAHREKVHEVLIDTDDLERVKKHQWHLKKDVNDYYVRTYTARNRGIFLHRLIMSAPQQKMVDHINHNTLDNRKENLRLATSSQNQQNIRGPKRNSKSGVLGVCWDKEHGKWLAQIQVNKKIRKLGRFDDINEAEKVVKKARAKLMPYSKEAMMRDHG